jgi:hypothetical protein
MVISDLRKLLCIAPIAVLVICSGIAAADPQNGIGAYVGLIGAKEGGSESKGLSLGMDAQFASKDKWSLNPYLMVSAERDSASKTLADGLAGLQVRRWFDDWFVGGQFFVHDTLVFSNSTVQSSTYGPGMGIVSGFEYANGWGVEVQSESFEYASQGVPRNAVRLHLTYRWY